jgi:hypothetical protein
MGACCELARARQHVAPPGAADAGMPGRGGAGPGPRSLWHGTLRSTLNVLGELQWNASYSAWQCF